MRHTIRPPGTALAILFVAVLGAGTLARATGADPSLLVMPLAASDMTPSMRDAIGDAIHDAAARRVPAALRGRQATRALIQDATTAGLTCSLDTVECAVRLGSIAEVGEVLLPVMAGNDTVRITLIDVATRRGIRMVVDRPTLPSQDDGKSLRELVGRVESPPALLDFNVKPAGASVFVDGMRLGTAPVLEAVAITPGEHDVVVELKPGETPAVQKVQVAPGARVAVAVDVSPPVQPEQIVVEQLPPEESPYYLPGVVTASAGLAGVVVCTAGLGAMEAILATPSRGENRELLQGVGIGFAVGIGVSAVAGVVGAGMLGQVFSQ